MNFDKRSSGAADWRARTAVVYPAAIALLLACSVHATAQDSGASSDTPSDNLAAQPAYTPLTLEQKWQYSVSEIFGPSRLAGYAASAIYGNIFNLPKPWGQSGDSLAVRLASGFGDSFIRHDLQFAIQALDHEDPRYFVSGRHGAWQRTKYAMTHTFIVRKDDGTWMPAYSLLAADYAMPYIVGIWRPERFSAINRTEVGSLGVTTSVGSNVFQEFWPDLRKTFSSHRFLHYFSSAGN